MDSRSEQRSRIGLRVVLHAKGNNLISGKLRDLSPNGMYVETPADAGVRKNHTVRVGFVVEDRLQIVRTRVARRTRDGLGLRLEGEQPAVRKALQDLLAAHERRARATA